MVGSSAGTHRHWTSVTLFLSLAPTASTATEARIAFRGQAFMGWCGALARRAPFSGTEEVVSPSHVAMVASGAAVITVVRLASAIAAESPAFSPPTMWLFLATDSVEAAAPHRKVLEGLVERLGPSRIRLSYTLEWQGSSPQARHKSAPQGWPYAVGDLTDLLASAELPPTPSGSGGPSSQRLVLTFGAPATKKLCEDIPRSSGTALWHWNDELDD